jgi:hypothetical protein
MDWGEVERTLAYLQGQWPGAELRVSDFEEYSHALLQAAPSLQLPVVTGPPHPSTSRWQPQPRPPVSRQSECASLNNTGDPIRLIWSTQGQRHAVLDGRTPPEVLRSCGCPLTHTTPCAGQLLQDARIWRGPMVFFIHPTCSFRFGLMCIVGNAACQHARCAVGGMGARRMWCAWCGAGEVGDTWIHGVASDPAKVADYRAVLRLRTACLASGACEEQVRCMCAG